MNDTVFISKECRCVLVAEAKASDLREAIDKTLAEKEQHEAAAKKCGELIVNLTVSLVALERQINYPCQRHIPVTIQLY